MINKQIRSVHITNYYHKTSGGISTVYNQLLNAANRHERRTSLIVPGEDDSIEEVGKYARIYYVKSIQSPIFDKRYRLILPWQYLLSGSQIRRILEAEQPDIIEVADKYTLSYLAGFIKKGGLKSLNRPMLVHLSCERMDDNLKAFVSGSRPMRWLARNVMGNYVAPMFDYHFANSEYTAQELKDAVGNNPDSLIQDTPPNRCWRYFSATKKEFNSKVFVTNCGVDLELFNVSRKGKRTRAKLLTEFGINEQATVLLYAGRLSPEKNVELLHKLMRSLRAYRSYDTDRRDYQLLIAGSGPQLDWLKKKLENDVPGQFHFAGHLQDKEKLADIYANSDIFIHPNPREPFGIAPLEAMASGTPVVAPNSGGVLSYANEQNAWIKSPDAEGYFAAVRDISNNPEKSKQKISNALETVKNFTWEQSFEHCFKLYDDLYAKFRADRSRFEPIVNDIEEKLTENLLAEKA